MFVYFRPQHALDQRHFTLLCRRWRKIEIECTQHCTPGPRPDRARGALDARGLRVRGARPKMKPYKRADTLSRVKYRRQAVHLLFATSFIVFATQKELLRQYSPESSSHLTLGR